MVIYCVIVDENDKVNYQRSGCHQKNGEKVLSNILYYSLKQNVISTRKNLINNNNGKKAKYKRTSKGREGKTIPIVLDRNRLHGKRHFLQRNKGRRMFLRSYLRKKNILKIFNNYELFKLFPGLLKAINILINLLLQYKIVNKIRKSWNRITPTKISRLKLSQLTQNLMHKTMSLRRFSMNNFMDKDTIRILLIRGNVEINPGPENHRKTSQIRNIILDIVTYNCNGLAVRNKRERVLSKANKITNAGGIVMLQETHIMKDEQIALYFKDKFQMNYYKTNSAGVATLFSNDFEVVHSFKDNIGRKLITLVQKEEEKYLLVNVYCPNDHKASLDFIEEVYLKILEIISDHPDCHVIMGGDFNSCLTELDFLNRNKTKIELELTNVIQQNNNMCGLFDSYRELNTDPGYTWNRGECYSRLDYIYVSETLKNQIRSSTINWSFDKSDHAALKTSIKIKEEIKKGPGIIKVNVDILKFPDKVALIREELIFLLNQIPAGWNGHTKLEYLKMTLRSILGKHTGIVRAEDKVEMEGLEASLNEIELNKVKIIRRKDRLTIY